MMFSRVVKCEEVSIWRWPDSVDFKAGGVWCAGVRAVPRKRHEFGGLLAV